MGGTPQAAGGAFGGRRSSRSKGIGEAASLPASGAEGNADRANSKGPRGSALGVALYKKVSSEPLVEQGSVPSNWVAAEGPDFHRIPTWLDSHTPKSRRIVTPPRKNH